MDSKYLFNKIVIAHAGQWIKQHVDNIDGEIPDICHKIKFAGYKIRAIDEFTDEEIKVMKKIGEDPAFKEIKDKNISLVNMALEIMRLWVTDIPKAERPIIGISDRKLLMGKNHYFKYLLEIKRQNKKLYDEQKEIIEETSAHAQVWYNWIKNRIEKEGKNEHKNH